MPFHVTKFEDTPNPNAVKCLLDRAISDRPRSFRTREAAEEDSLAAALFDQAGVTNVLFHGDWLTVNKPPDAAWRTVKAAVRKVLRSAPRE